jgi:hypothetical protein
MVIRIERLSEFAYPAGIALHPLHSYAARTGIAQLRNFPDISWIEGRGELD